MDSCWYAAFGDNIHMYIHTHQDDVFDVRSEEVYFLILSNICTSWQVWSWRQLGNVSFMRPWSLYDDVYAHSLVVYDTPELVSAQNSWIKIEKRTSIHCIGRYNCWSCLENATRICDTATLSKSSLREFHHFASRISVSCGILCWLSQDMWPLGEYFVAYWQDYDFGRSEAQARVFRLRK